MAEEKKSGFKFTHLIISALLSYAAFWIYKKYFMPVTNDSKEAEDFTQGVPAAQKPSDMDLPGTQYEVIHAYENVSLWDGTTAFSFKPGDKITKVNGIFYNAPCIMDANKFFIPLGYVKKIK